MGPSPHDAKQQRRQRATAHTSPLGDKLPPYSPEAEKALIGCVLCGASIAIAEIQSAFANPLDAMYEVRNKSLLRLCIEMYDRMEPVTIETVAFRLKELELLQNVGGLAYLSSAMESAPTEYNAPFWLDILKQKLTLRKMLAMCSSIMQAVYDPETEAERLLETLEGDVMGMRNVSKKTDYQSMKELVPQALTHMEAYHARAGQLIGLTTGIPKMDVMTGGLMNGQVWVIAARPSMGKSSLMMNIFEAIALVQKEPVGIFSLEMSSVSLAMRSLCTNAQVSMTDVRNGLMGDRDFPKLTGAAGKLTKAPIYIDDASGLSILQLRAKARRMHQVLKLKALGVDYLQLLHATMNGRRMSQRQQEVGEIMGGLKALAKELDIPVIVLSQLNREMEKEQRKPNLGDLRESGSIEQDADLVCFLYKPETDSDLTEAQMNFQIPVNLLIAKQRNGPTGDIELLFQKPFTRYIEKPIEIEPEPTAEQPPLFDERPDNVVESNIPYNDA